MARKEYNHETSIHSRLVSHSSQPASLDDIRVYSVRGVASALVGSLTFSRSSGGGSNS